jgi:Asp-tRNA(Asn)/Glu-tRNA(Gln) amidotransferase C subunit
MAVKIPSKLHTMSPTFQKAWYKRNKMELPPHLTGSVKQASKEVKPSERVKKLQTKSLQAYGATKGLKVGGEHGSGEMKDTIAPLTRDQHSKVQAAARAAKAAEKPAAKKTPLTKSQRMAAIAAAVRKAQSKHDVPTMEPDDEGHDDLRDLHQSLHIRKGYNEEIEQIDEMDKSQPSSSRGAEGLATGTKATPATVKKTAADALKILKKKLNPVKEEVEQIEEASPMIKPPTNRFDKKSDAFAHAEKHGGRVYKQTYTDSKGQQTVSYSVKKEEVEMNEASKAEAEKLLGGPVKTRTGTEPKGKLPLGFRQARNLARKAMKTGKTVTESTTEVNEMSSHGKALAKAIMAKQSKRPIAQQMGEAIKDQADVGEYDYEGDMAKSQLRSIMTNAKRMHDMLEDTTNLPEWVQSKITLAEDYVLTAANYMEGEMNEEVEQVDEKINLVKAKMGDVIKDFQKSDAPQFKGKSMEKRREMAIAAKLGAEREVKEEVEQIDELDRKTRVSYLKKSLTQLNNIASSRHTSGNKTYGSKEVKKRLAGLSRIEKSGNQPASVRDNIDKARAQFEEVEQIDEGDLSIRTLYNKWADHYTSSEGNSAKRADAVEKTITKVHGHEVMNHLKKAIKANLRNDMDQEENHFERARNAAEKSGSDRVNATVGKDRSKFRKEEIEQVTEAEGTVAVTPKEKELAKHHGDPNKITYGDVIKARLKSAAAKKMGK